MSHTLKVLLRIIYARIRTKLEQRLGSLEFRFRGGYRTRKILFGIQLAQQCLDQQEEYEKAFDTIKHAKLTELSQLWKIYTKDFQIITNLYWNQTANINYDGSGHCNR